MTRAEAVVKASAGGLVSWGSRIPSCSASWTKSAPSPLRPRNSPTIADTLAEGQGSIQQAYAKFVKGPEGQGFAVAAGSLADPRAGLQLSAPLDERPGPRCRQARRRDRLGCRLGCREGLIFSPAGAISVSAVPAA